MAGGRGPSKLEVWEILGWMTVLQNGHTSRNPEALQGSRPETTSCNSRISRKHHLAAGVLLKHEQHALDREGMWLHECPCTKALVENVYDVSSLLTESSAAAFQTLVSVMSACAQLTAHARLQSRSRSI